MSIDFLYPNYWWALLGLLLPLIIHLWNRREGKRILVGSIQWMEADQEKRPSSIQFSDFWLFLLRMLLLIAFVFLLLRPVMPSETSRSSTKWVLADSAVAHRPSVQVLLDSFEAEGYMVQELTAFAEDSSLIRNYWDKLSVLADREPLLDTVLMVADPEMRYLSGRKPGFPFFVQWLPLPGPSASHFLVEAWQQEQQIVLLIGTTVDTLTEFQIYALPERVGSIQLGKDRPTVQLINNESSWQAQVNEHRLDVKNNLQIKVAICYDKGFEGTVRNLSAAIEAVSRFTTIPIQKEEKKLNTTIPEADWVFWLSDQPLPDSLARVEEPKEVWPFFDLSGKYVVFRRQLKEPDAKLADALLELFFLNYQEEALAFDRRQVDVLQRQPIKIEQKNEQVAGKTPSGKSLAFPVWLGVLVLFFIERIYIHVRIHS